MQNIKTFLAIYFTFSNLNLFAFENTEWTLVSTEDDIEVFGSKEKENGLIPFKAQTNLKYSIDDLLKVLLDYNSKPQWSPKLSKVKIHKIFSFKNILFSEFYKTPWPAKDREFLLEGHIKTSHNKVELVAKSIKNANYSNQSYVQADVHFLNLTLEKITTNHTKVSFEFLGDMKGWMPIWLMNLIQKKWPLRFLQGLQKQVQKKQLNESPLYRNYKNNKVSRL